MTVAARPFGYWTATAMVVGGMIGAGIFVLPAMLAPYGWIGVVAWGVTIAGVLAIGQAMARLVRAMPGETGAVAIAGAALGPAAGCLVGWSYWISVWTAVTAIAASAVGYLGAIVPWLGGSPVRVAAATLGLIWLFTLASLAGAAFAGRIQVATTVLKLLPLVAVIAIVLWLVGSGAATLPAWPAASPDVTGPAGLTAAVTLTFFPMVGFETAGLIAGRVIDPARNVPRATLSGILAVGLLYVLVSSGIGLLLPADRVAASPAPFALFVETFWGRGAGLLVAAFAAIAAIGALNCWVLVQGEVPLGMARAGLLPGWFGRTGRGDVPVGPLLLSSLLASLLVLATAGRGTGKAIEFAILLTTCSSLWFYVAICAAALVRRVAMPVAAAGLAFCGWALVGAGLEAGVWSLALMLTALPLYWWRRRAPAPGPGPSAPIATGP